MVRRAVSERVRRRRSAGKILRKKDNGEREIPSIGLIGGDELNIRRLQPIEEPSARSSGKNDLLLRVACASYRRLVRERRNSKDYRR